MNKNNDDLLWKQRMNELEEKNKYYKLKRREKLELKSLHKKNSEINMKIRKSKEEEMKKQKKEILERQLEYRKAQ